MFADIGASEIAKLLALSLLHFIWQGALIALAYQCARAASARLGCAAQAACGQLAFLAFALAPVATLWWLAGGEPAAAPSAVVEPGLSGAVVASVGAVSEVLAEQVDALPHLPELLVAGWLAGVLLLSLSTFRDWRRAHRATAAAAAVDPRWQRHLCALAARLNLAQVPDLREAAGLASPYLFGWFRPVVVMPLGLLARLPTDQIEALLLHELAHARRLDYIANLAQRAVEIVLFYHPLIYWVARQLRADRERACDELVIAAGADRMAYARALAGLEADRHGQRLNLAMAATGGALLNRIERIVGVSESAPAGSSSLSPAAVLLMAGVLVGVAGWGLNDRVHELRGWLDDGRQWLPAVTLDVPELRAVLHLPPRPLQNPPMPSVSAPIAAVEARPAQMPTVESEPLQLAGVLERPAPALIEPAPIFQQAAAAPEQAPAAEPQLAAALPVRPRALSARAPSYPRAARLSGQEGSVILAFSIDRSGRAFEIDVVSATAPGVFERAAVDALRRWRFADGAAGSDPARRFEQAFDFRLSASSDVASRGERSSDCDPVLGTRICRIGRN